VFRSIYNSFNTQPFKTIDCTETEDKPFELNVMSFKIV